jgi:hypothetical protein
MAPRSLAGGTRRGRRRRDLGGTFQKARSRQQTAVPGIECSYRKMRPVRRIRLQFSLAFATPLSSGARAIPNSKRWQGVEARSKRGKRGDDLTTVVPA